MSNTRRNEDDNCIKGQIKRDNDIHDYCLNRPSNNCTDNKCVDSNPEIRVPHNNNLINREIESKLFRLDQKDDCDPDNHSCNGNICKTQVFEDLDPSLDNKCATDFTTVNSRLDSNVNIMEKSYNRFDWLPFSPQKHTINHDSQLKTISSRLESKDNHNLDDDIKPSDTTNQLEYNDILKKQSYEVAELPNMHENPAKKNNYFKFLN